MAENTELKPENTQEQEASQLTEIEQRAIDMGWRPKEEFDGPEDDFIDAKEFVRRKPLFDKIEAQSKETKQLRKALDALTNHYNAREEAAIKNALSKLQAARKEAITNSDGEAFAAIDAEIKRVEKDAEKLKAVEAEVQPEIHPEFQAFLNKNPWYSSTRSMQAWADDYGIELRKQGMTPSEVLKRIEQEVKKEFPHKFKNPNKENAPSVESGKGEGSTREAFELSEQERKVMNTLVSTKQMTKEEYIKQLKAMYPERVKK